jgi:glycosyltransferase involved in cell wall biosynthesis
VSKAILFISDDIGRGGTEVGLLQTATGLARERWCPLVIVPACGYLYEMCTRAGLDTRVLNFYRLPRFWRVRRYFPIDSWLTILVNGRRLKRLLQRERIALVQTSAKETLNVRNLARVARAAGVPLVWSCHDSNPKVLTYCRQGLGAKIDRIVAISHHVREELLRAGIEEPDKIEVLHNAIDIKAWDARTSAIDSSLREELGIPHNRPVVGLVARLDPIKGQRAFLLAADLVAQACPDAVFLLVGVVRPTSRWAVFADYFREVEALARRPTLQGRVLFAEWRTDLPRVMESLDILVQPSLRETFGRVLIEAMASRKPAVVTRVGGMPEIVVNGETGIVVPPEDPPALAAAVVSLLQDRARSQNMGEAGRRRVEERFTLPDRIRRLESIYNEMLR